MALVADFCFGRVGGSAITIDVCGRAIGGAKSITVYVGGCGSAGARVFFDFVDKRTRNALEIFDWSFDDTALMSTAMFYILSF